MENEFCDFGCGKKAIKTYKNGKKCCSNNVNSCPAKRERDASKKRGKNPWKDKPYPKHRLNIWNKGMVGRKMEDIVGSKEKAEQAIKMGLETRMKKCGKMGVAYDEDAEKERRIKISKKMKLVGGGYRKGSGRGKKGWYMGYFCDSSYELAYVIYNLEHGIKFERNTKKFEYKWNEEIHYWLPDFILEDGSYVEIKGYDTAQSIEKTKQFPLKIIKLKEKDLKYVFDYVIEKYGKDFIKLYETKNMEDGSHGVKTVLKTVPG